MAFLAIPIPYDLQASMTAGLAALKKAWPDVQWVHPEDYHVTLRFIGGLQPEALSRLLIDIEGQGQPFIPFTLNLQGISSFPPHRERGVLWIGLKSQPTDMIDLQSRLEQQVQALGFVPENRPLTPHITIGRFNKSAAADLMQALSAFGQQEWGSLLCREYVLMRRRSGAKEGGNRPLYEVLTRFPV